MSQQSDMEELYYCTLEALAECRAKGVEDKVILDLANVLKIDSHDLDKILNINSKQYN